MGNTNHNSVIATTWCIGEFKRLSTWVKSQERRDLFLLGQAMKNFETTIVMVPDGSKEGWGDSNNCDKLRSLFICELEKGNYDDGSSPWKYVEVGFGDYGQKVLNGNNKNRIDNSKYCGD